MRCWVLGSGSRGNAVLVEAAGTRVLVDCGFSPRALAARLAAAGFTPADVHAVVLTHEHQDHAGGATAAASKWGWGLFATPGTLSALGIEGTPLPASGLAAVGHAVVETVRVPHDAAQPVAVVVGTPDRRQRCGVAMDLGHAPAALLPLFRDLDVLVLEANHDEGLLAASPYPASVQRRISGRLGHLSNAAAARIAAAVAHRGLRHVVLAHLSETSNTPALATAAMREALAATRFRGAVHAARADGPVGPFAASRTTVSAPGQYELGLLA